MSQVFGHKSRKGFLWAALLIVILAVAGLYVYRQPGAPTGTQTGEEVAAVAPAPAPAPAPQEGSTAEETKAGPDVSGAPAEPETAATPAPVLPSFDVVRVTPEGDAVIAGRAGPGSRVGIIIDGAEVTSTEADARGNFVAFLKVEAGTEPRVLSLRETTTDGREGTSADTVILTPPAPQPEPVQVAEAPPPEAAPEPAAGTDAADTSSQTEAPGDGSEQAAAPGTEEVPAEAEARAPGVLLAGEGGVRLLQPPSPAPGEGPGGNIVIDAISYDTEGEVAITGRASAGEHVRVYVDNAPVHVGPVGEDGTWRADLPQIEGGVYTLRIDEVDAAGKVMSRVETPFKREQPEVLARAAEGVAQSGQKGVTLVTVQPGYTLWGIATRNYGSGFQYVRIFEANRDQIRDPDLIYPGQIFEVPGDVN